MPIKRGSRVVLMVNRYLFLKLEMGSSFANNDILYKFKPTLDPLWIIVMSSDFGDAGNLQ